MSRYRMSLDALERIRFTPNWKVKGAEPRRFLIRETGDWLETIGQGLVEELLAQGVNDVQVGLAWETNQQAGQMRSLCVRTNETELHHAVADVTLRRQGRDLFVSHMVRGKTWLTHLRQLTFVTATVLLWSLIYVLFLSVTDNYGSLSKAFADKYHKDPMIGQVLVKYGLKYDSSEEELIKKVQGMSMLDIARADPRIFLFNMGGPPALIATGIGFLVYFCLRYLMHPLCRLLGWPTPDDYESMVVGHAAWVESVLSSVLMHQFGVGQDQIQPVGR